MEQNKLKTPKKGAVKRMRELYEKNRGKASAELIEILKTPPSSDVKEKKSALPSSKQDAEL
jgi:hypothetical protein